VRHCVRRLSLSHLIASILALVLGWPAAAGAQASGSATLDAVRARGELLCGTSGEIVGFSLPDSRGVMRGLDSDGCRAIAAATLGDANKVRFVPLTAQNRFIALQSGEADVLIRNTGWSLTREANLGLMFAAINFWDGTSFIVKTASGVTSVKQLGGATICVRPGTSTELDLADWARLEKISYTPVLIGGVNEVQDAFMSGRCDAFVTDSSQVAGFRFKQGDKAGDLTILPEPINSGPAGSMVRKGDDKWYDIVRWVHFAQVAAEDLGVNSTNVDSFAATTNPAIKRLLGMDGDLGKALGLDNKWAAQAIRQVGNYGEMYDRSILVMGLQRGQNALMSKGGLQFAPPLR
jgi:general L-amino acid transport system substrate-binding protein